MTWTEAISLIRNHEPTAFEIRQRAIAWCEEHLHRYTVPTSITPAPDHGGGLILDWRNKHGKLKHAVEFMPEGDELTNWQEDRIVSTEVIQ